MIWYAVTLYELLIVTAFTDEERTPAFLAVAAMLPIYGRIFGWW